MKKVTSLSVSLLLTPVMLCGQSKINPQGIIMVEQYKAELATMQAQSSTQGQTVVESAIVRLNEGYTAQALVDMGFEVNTDLSDIVTIQLPLDRVGELEASDAVKSISMGVEMSPMMNLARASGSVDDIHGGFDYNGTQVTFDGTGVIAGIMDTGLEANHVNFTDEGGNSRVAVLWHFTGSNGNGSVREYNSSNINRFTSDSRSETHATHVAGIMAGSYNGESRYVNLTTAVSGGSIVNGNNPYYGVAPGATIAASVGSLSQANIIDGVANIVDYAEANNMPCVVNLSLGTTVGPHDGTDGYAAALSKLGRRAIIVMASGNDGDSKLSIAKTFSASDTQLKTLIEGNKAQGAVDVWGSDNTEFTVSWGIYDQDKQELIILATSEVGKTVYINSQNSTFSTYFNGSIEMAAGVNANNNRYNVYSNCGAVAKTTNTTKLLSLIVEGKDGVKVNVYGSKVTFENPYWVGWTGGTTTNSLNDACCGDNIVSVGAYTTRTHWSELSQSGSFYYPGNTLSDICPFSSYGTSFQGVAHPMVAAPGSAIISSYNNDYISATGTQDDMIATAQGTSSTDYWGQMQGTSMACPFVSGTVALWLEADPTLDFSKVCDVIASTSTIDRYTRKAPERFGAGKLNALAGLKMVLDNRAGVGAIVADDARNFILTAIDGGYNVYVAGESALTVTLYDAAGGIVASASASDNSIDVDTSSLRPGIYILAAQGNTQRHTAKIVVK